MSRTGANDPVVVSSMVADGELRELARQLFLKSCDYRYSYNFSWMGVPIIQYPQDMMAMQEIIWRVKPDLIVETGIAHGGSLVFYASMLALLGGEGRVLGIDIDIRAHNREVIESHPMAPRITMFEGSSIEDAMAKRVRDFAKGAERVLVVLDSNHTHDHVLKELELYAPLVTRDSYVVVFDSVIEDMAEDAFPDRPWGRGNNPKTAIRAFLDRSDAFVVDHEVEDKLLLTVAPEGYLRRVKD